MALQKVMEHVTGQPLHTTALEYAQFLVQLISMEQAPGRLLLVVVANMLQHHVKVTPELEWGLGWGLVPDQRVELLGTGQ